jgi:hypothetical protein
VGAPAGSAIIGKGGRGAAFQSRPDNGCNGRIVRRIVHRIVHRVVHRIRTGRG